MACPASQMEEHPRQATHGRNKRARRHLIFDDCGLLICKMFVVGQTSSDVCRVDDCGRAMREALDYSQPPQILMSRALASDLKTTDDYAGQQGEQ
jgi:hypothetical protein